MEGFFFKGGRLFLVDVKSPGVGNCGFLHALGVGNGTSIKEKNCKSPLGGGGVPRGMVTARSEPCIIRKMFHSLRTVKKWNVLTLVTQVISCLIRSLSW